MRMKLVLEYDGSNYHGFQVQNNAYTVQAELEKAIQSLTGENLTIMAAGRTDSGVHALGQVIAFDTDASIPADRWHFALNSFLPDDIRIIESQEVNADFHPRFDALKKRYSYVIYRHKEGATFFRRYAWCNSEKLDIRAMEQGAPLFTGRQNFKAFCASGSSVKTFEREVSDCTIQEKGPRLFLHIEANGFLYNMVRIIMGTLVEVGRGKYGPEYIQEAIASRERSQAGPTAPPQGLYLRKVIYPGDTLKAEG